MDNPIVRSWHSALSSGSNEERGHPWPPCAGWKPAFRSSGLCIILAGVLLSTPVWVPGQSRVGDWQSHTSVIDLRETVEFDGKSVSTTSGGLLILDFETENFQALTNIDGLVETDLSALAVDRNGHLWIGSSAPIGIVQVYDLEKREPVKTFDFDLSEITDIAVSDSVVFASFSQNLNWGILEFIWENGEFHYRQVYRPLEDNLQPVYSVEIRGDSLFAGTGSGLRVGDYRKHILNYPQNWQSVTGLGEDPVTRLRNVGTEILAVADGRIWSFDGTLHQETTRIPNLLDVVRLPGGTLYGITTTHLIRYTSDGSQGETWKLRARANSLAGLDDGRLIVSSRLGLGVWFPDREAFEWHTPNSPVSNVYTALTVLDDGRLVAAGREGVSILSEYGWYNFVPSSSKAVLGPHDRDEFNSFVADTAQYKTSRVWSVVRWGNRIYFSIQGVFPDTSDFGDPIGGGIVSFDLDRPWEYTVYDTTDDRINPWDEKGYMNVRSLIVDGEDNLWVSNFAASDNDKKITVVTPDDTWIHIPQTGVPESLKLFNPTDIVFVSNGLFLIGGHADHTHTGGLFVLSVDLNEDPPDVRWNAFFENNGLASSTVWSLDSQEPGVAWILTSGGLQRIDFNRDYSRITPYFFTYFAGVPLAEGSKMKMDSRGNVWIASVSGGLYVLLANSTPWPDWSGFRHDSSPLLSDEVSAVDFDNERGIAYIATSKGINTLRVPFAHEKKSFAGLTTFPSPFRVPSDQTMVIDGLMDNSSIRIMTLDGRVLRDISSASSSVQGYQAFWDGRTDGGDLVGTGVYLLAVYSESGETHLAKIAVIRH